jgi:hypothetical protein
MTEGSCNIGKMNGKKLEQRNHGLKYDSDSVSIGIGIKNMNCGRFGERLFL